MTSFTLPSPAKLNLFLHITGKRADGYHNLQTVFRLIDFYDEMQFSVLDNGRNNVEKNVADIAPVSLTADNVITQNPADNLVIKAGQALYKFAKENLLTAHQLAALPVIAINLKKAIPTGAGLGGGSSNCATTLLALNHLWALNLNNQQLCQIGVKLGADVPIFIVGQDAIAQGIGEVLTPIDLPPQRYLLLTPNAHINTAQLFAHPLLRRDCPSLGIGEIMTKKAAFLTQLTAEFRNVFTPVVCELSLEVKTALNYLHGLEEFAQSNARMSGSGSSVFLPIPDTIAASLVETWIRNVPCQAFIVNSLPADFVQQQINNNFCKKC